MTVQPLQLPPIINVPQLNFAPLNQAGDAIAGAIQRNTIANSLPAMLGQQPQPQGNSLATLGQPRPSPIDSAANAIGNMESGGNYSALGPVTPSGDRAYGKYQVMGANVGPWTQQVLGQALTPQQFLASPQAQDAVFRAKFGQYAQQFGPEGAAKAWFAGPAGMNNPNATDQNGTTVNGYAQRFDASYVPSSGAAPSQPATSQPGGAGIQPSPAASGAAPSASQPSSPTQPQGSPTMPSVPPATMARIQAMIRAGGPAQQFAMALLQRYVVPQYQVLHEGDTLVNPITQQLLARGTPKAVVQTPGSTVGFISQGPNGQPIVTNGGNNTTGLMSDQAVALQGQRAMKGDFSVFAQTGRGTIGQLNTEKIINYMAANGATADQLNAAKGAFETQIAAQKAFGTGTQGNTVRSLNVAINHLDTLRQYATALSNGNVQTINALRNRIKEEFGYNAPTNFTALVPLVSGEVAKAVIGSNNAISDRQDLQEALHGATSPAQIAGAIGAYEHLMGGQLGGLRTQYETSTHQKDFNKFLSPQTQAVLGGMSSPRGGAPSFPKVTNRADANSAIAAAKAAIAQGADPKAVNARLQAMGVPPLAGQ